MPVDMHGPVLPLTEPIPVVDIFADAIGQIERLGAGCARFTLVCHDGGERRIVAKIIVQLTDAPEMMATAAGWLTSISREAVIGGVAHLLS